MECEQIHRVGSLLTFTGEDGKILHEQNFDAWGRYRNITDGSYVNVPSRPRWMYRGYTGHEHLEQQGLDVGYFDLINMNARLYDPINGRCSVPITTSMTVQVRKVITDIRMPIIIR